MKGAGKLSDSVAKLEVELARVWEEPDAALGISTGKVRAAMMNLVSACQNADTDRIMLELDELGQTHESRVFIATMDGHVAPWDFEGDVSAICRKVGGGAEPVCSDRIHLRFGALSASRAASVISPLLLSELPLVLDVQPGAPGVLVEAIAPIADRVIVNTEHTSLEQIAQIRSSTKGHMTDRVFVSTLAWRELIARAFDELPKGASIQGVEVTVSKNRTHDRGAALLLGWLGSRFGWTPVSRTQATSPGGIVAIGLSEATSSAASPWLGLRLDIATSAGPTKFTCRVTPEGDHVEWSIDGSVKIAQRHALGLRDPLWVSTHAIDATPAMVRVCEGALAWATSWVAAS